MSDVCCWPPVVVVWLAAWYPARVRSDGDSGVLERAQERSAQTLAEDVSLIAAVAGGDRKALASLYDRYSGLLLALAMRVLQQRQESEDLLHDVFVEVWRRAGDYDAARGSVRAWLVLRMRSRAIDRRKSARISRSVPIVDESSGDTARRRDARPPLQTSFDPLSGLEHQRVRLALHELPADQREALELAYFDGLSMVEVGERLGIPAGTVKSRLSAARARLRALLDESAPDTRGPR